MHKSMDNYSIIKHIFKKHLLIAYLIGPGPVLDARNGATTKNNRINSNY